MRNLNSADHRIALAGRMLGALASGTASVRPTPRPAGQAGGSTELTAADRELSGALMRVNHVGEVCAQALYEGQALATRSEALRAEFLKAAEEEGDHLHWTRERLRELGARPSLLNPLWYGGALLMGMTASRMGDRMSLGFMAETERQVERHLDGHLSRLPAADLASRAIVTEMKADEVRHARRAVDAGARDLPWPLPGLMRMAAGVMTRVAHRV